MPQLTQCGTAVKLGAPHGDVPASRIEYHFDAAQHQFARNTRDKGILEIKHRGVVARQPDAVTFDKEAGRGVLVCAVFDAPRDHQRAIVREWCGNVVDIAIANARKVELLCGVRRGAGAVGREQCVVWLRLCRML